VDQAEIFYKIADIFQPFYIERANQLNKPGSNKLFAHYTSAENAINIIRGKQLWMRDAGVMNDFSEIGHGQAVLASILDAERGAKARSILNHIDTGLGDRVLQAYKESLSHVRECVFMTSLCEHDAISFYGKLSMWRAYGGPVAGVALLFKNHLANLRPASPLNLALLPVLYGSNYHYAPHFDKFLVSLETGIPFLKSVPAQLVEVAALAAVQFASYTIKHLAFAEEEEWRVIYRPYVAPSPIIPKRIETIAGIPQAVHPIPFHCPNGNPPALVPELDLNDILESVLIGPCTYPETVFRAMTDVLTDAGLENVRERVRYTNIPMRQIG